MFLLGLTACMMIRDLWLFAPRREAAGTSKLGPLSVILGSRSQMFARCLRMDVPLTPQKSCTINCHDIARSHAATSPASRFRLIYQ